MERAGRDVTRIVAAGADAVDAVVETFLIEGEDFFFAQMMELQGLTCREVDEVDVVAVEDVLQESDVCRFDGTAGKAQRQFLSVKSLRRFDELREAAADFFLCFFCDLSHFINTPYLIENYTRFVPYYNRLF